MKRASFISVATLLAAPLAFAQSASNQAQGSQAAADPDAPPVNVHLVDDAVPAARGLARQPDLLGKHLLLGAATGPAWSLGRLASDLAAARGLGTGIALRADAALGLSRSIAIGVWGGFAGYADGDTCSSCAAQTFAAGPFVRYHLSQGLRLNPWLALGGGLRRLSFDAASGARQKFSGVEWLHLELGADYYVFSGLGVGPYGSLSATSYTTRPADAGGASVNTELSAGLRLLLDLPGR